MPVLLLCSDTDKSTHLTVSATSFSQFNVDWEEGKVSARVAYTLSRLARTVNVRVIGPNFATLFTGTGAPTASSQRETDEFTFNLPSGDAAVGTYTAVVDAEETTADAEEYNRDPQQRKWAWQGLGTHSLPWTITLSGGVGKGEDLWWFNGESPANYNTEVTATVHGLGTTGTFTWEVTAGVGKVKLLDNQAREQDEVELEDTN